MDEHNSFWVLSRVSLEIYKYVVLKIIINMASNKKFMFGRDYLILNKDNEVIMQASSIWAVMSKDKRIRIIPQICQLY